MRYVLTLLMLIFCCQLHAQNLTGIWRGHFSQGMGPLKQRYKYEVQINQLANRALKGVTYSYKTTVFYGKASLQGIFMSQANNIVVKENKLLEVKSTEGSDACLMTCYLEYLKRDGVEMLYGTFTSINIRDKSDCGSGTVYLEKVPESDFVKENFILEYERRMAKAKPPVKKPPVTAKTPDTRTVTPGQKPKTSASSGTVRTQPKPGSPAKTPAQTTNPLVIDGLAQAPKDVDIPEAPRQKKDDYIPRPLRERENALVKTLVTTRPEIRIELYDNGEIDNDTVTIYHNNQLMTYKRRLSHAPITLRITASEEEPVHEFVMVADNLGSIPPNTALMVVTLEGKRYELNITSTEQKNARVRIEYRPHR